MQDLILYHLVSGHAWFTSGLLMLSLASLDALGVLLKRTYARRAARAGFLTAVLVAGLSGTPVRIWLAIPLVLACLILLFFGFSSMKSRARTVMAVITGVLLLAALGFELPYHFAQLPEVPRPRQLYILGDSITAGEGGKQVTWPRLLAETTKIQVHDLARPGATVQTALAKQAPVVVNEADLEAWVFLEIGGNDMLGDTTAEAFGAALDELLTVVRGDPERPRRVLMMELPLIPGKWSFGAWQRELAARHGVVLIPKRVLAGIVLTAGNVTDGLHLSQAGQDQMAEVLLPWIGRP